MNEIVLLHTSHELFVTEMFICFVEYALPNGPVGIRTFPWVSDYSGKAFSVPVGIRLFRESILMIVTMLQPIVQPIVSESL